MKLSEISENVFPEDKMNVAVKNGCSYDYVNKILRGQRSIEPELAENIIADLEALALVNIDMYCIKAALLAA